jgi:GalNAc-alpha-(1->4)-GalNAc-alpha-(1->3)-diNAcBac-PP-undecaprenol alpha-1,4-N-acetyl-D-galactosaminyltransferase
MRRQALPARAIRILCLIPSLDAGGAQRAMTRLVSALAERHHVTVMTYEGAECAPFYPLPPSVQLVRADLLGGTGLRRLYRIAARLPAIRRLVRQTAPAVVLSFMDTMNITAVAACLGTGIPVVVSERTDPHRHRIPRLKSWLRLLAYAMANRIVVQTARVRHYQHGKPVPMSPPPGGGSGLSGLAGLNAKKALTGWWQRSA